MKFVKTLMTARALEQQKQKVVKKVMGKNKEAKAEGQEISKEMEKQIWEQAKQNVKNMQEEQIGNQVGEKHEAKVGKTRYEHIAAIMGLMPDELAQSISAMVQES